MKKFFSVVAIALMATLGATSISAKTKTNDFKIHRGTNLSHWLSQNTDRGEMRRLHIQEDDMARLDSLGFDFVRIPIDEEQFWDEKGNKLPEAWGLLTSNIDLALKHHLRVIVDLHIIRAHNFNAVNEGKENTLFVSKKSQQSLIDMWYQLSKELKHYSCDSVAYEFMNEPVADKHEQWNQLIARVHKALRKIEPQRTLVIGSNKWQSTETFKYLRIPRGDKNIVLSFHFYDPQVLTHYGAWWTPIGKYKGNVNYPGVMVTQAEYDAAPEEIKPELKQYCQEWNREVLHQRMADAIAVAKKYDVQLFCGEWGVYEPVNREWAYKWTSDMLDVFDEFNVAWCTWCYDADFGFWDQFKHTFKDKGLVDLLTRGVKK